jgi:SAM-dependent methyltransferase
MTEQIQKLGVLTNPVEFQNGEPIPANPDKGIEDPQNLWHTIDANRLWVEREILDLGGSNPYREPDKGTIAKQRIEIADTRRANGGKYTDRRGLSALADFLFVPEADVVNVFTGRTVLDIGSGAGNLSNELRREAGAFVTELDFSSEVFSRPTPVFENMGTRVIADGARLPFPDSSFGSSVSMYSTSVHTDSVRDRLTSLTEMFRVTEEGGEAFVVPLFGGLVMRQQRWLLMHRDPVMRRGLLQDVHLRGYEKKLRQEAAMDYALTELIRALIVKGDVIFTPILTQQEKNGQIYDNISGIFQINNHQTNNETEFLVSKLVKKFS